MEKPRGRETDIDWWSMPFDTADMREIVVKAHKAADGLQQNVEKLGAYLHNMIAGY